MSLVDLIQAKEYYDTLSLKELKRYQEIVQAQIPMAHSQKKTRALEDLQAVDSLVADAIHRKAFPA